MADVFVVFDVHVFLDAIANKKGTIANKKECVEVYDTMIKKCHKLLINKDVSKRYSSLMKKRGMSPRLLDPELKELDQKKKLKKRKRAEVNISGLTEDDMTFLETACAGADTPTYLVTNDSHFHKNKKKFYNKGCKFEVVYPHTYVNKFEEN